jgi:DNA repair protein RadA/Sms
MEEIVEKAANPKHGVKSKEAAGKVQTLDSIKNESTPRIY